MAKERSDFAQVRLSAEARAQLGDDAAMSISTAHLTYSFRGADPQEVMLSEWRTVLARELYEGHPLFELVPASAATAAAATTATPDQEAQA